MNILNINFSDTWGGASLAGYRLHQEFKKVGFSSKLLVGHKKTNDDDVVEILPKNKYVRYTDRLLFNFFHHISLPNTYYMSSRYLKTNQLLNKWADFVLLRNIHGDYLSENMLPYISNKVPVVWRLPDMWAITGHCAYSMECDRWLIGCGQCPRLRDYYPLKFDTTHYLWNRKKEVVQKSNITVVAPSQWLKSMVEKSEIFQGKNVVYIPTAVNEVTFYPLDKKQAKSYLKIPIGYPVIMFGSQDLNDKRKGGHFIEEILHRIHTRLNKKLIIISIGKSTKNFSTEYGEHLHFGHIENDHLLNLIYNCADIYALPSLADNLPNTLIEAIATGLPTVVFDSGGCSEAVAHGKSGFVVEAGNIEEFSKYCSEILLDESKQNDFALNARRKALENYTMKMQVESYIELFKKIKEKS